MALYRYVKAPISYSLESKEFFWKEIFKPNFSQKTLPLIFMFCGLFLMSLVVIPLVAYKFHFWRWRNQKIISPVPDSLLVEATGWVSPLRRTSEQKIKGEKVEVIEKVDYNLINNWFPSKPVPPVKPSKITHYSLSIPKLKIKEALVTIGGKELDKSLIHYPGTALPGEYGNTVIFGHSVLPAFYNPKDYRSIFSLIPTLVKDDEIIIEYDGMKFFYLVEDYKEVKPEEIGILEQRFDRQMLTLITCVPPGTYLRRGILTARLVRF